MSAKYFETIEDEWREWYSLSPKDRWTNSAKLWDTYILLGGSLDPEPDTQSPFFDSSAPITLSTNGRTGLRSVRGGMPISVRKSILRRVYIPLGE